MQIFDSKNITNENGNNNDNNNYMKPTRRTYLVGRENRCIRAVLVHAIMNDAPLLAVYRKPQNFRSCGSVEIV